MARKGHPAPHVKERPINHFKGFPNLTLFKLLNDPRLPYFRKVTIAGVELYDIYGGKGPIRLPNGRAYTPGLATIPQRAGPVIVLKGAREQARRLRQMGRGAS
jgi:hypothetical protein